MNNQNDKVKIKLERHQWPDEVKQKKKSPNKIIIVLTVVAIGVSFLVGWAFSDATKGSSSAVVANSEVARFERVYNKLLKSWYFTNEMENPSSQLIENAIKGMIELNGDPHTAYMTQEESDQFTTSIDMSFVGIGVMYYAGEDLNLITRVYKDSPAETAGLKAGDIMVSIDGHLVKDITGAGKDIKDFILGEEGTKVNVTVDRQGEMLDFEITRGQINALTWGEMIDRDIAYLEISSFGQTLKSSTKVYLDYFKSQNAKDLIIDLRDNGGGYLGTINDISELLFESGATIYKEQFTDGSETVYKVSSSEANTYKFDSIVVLINENTASAAEVLTLAMTENLNVKTVGVTSYGKGTVQTQVQDSIDNSYLKYTMAKWYSPSGESIHEVGIVPSVEVKLPAIFYKEYVVLDEGVTYDYDSVSDAASYVQAGLSFLGYHSGRIDGYYDASTREALLGFLAAHNQPQSTVITQDTIRLVYASVLAEWTQNKSIHDVQLQKAVEVIKNGR